MLIKRVNRLALRPIAACAAAAVLPFSVAARAETEETVEARSGQESGPESGKGPGPEAGAESKSESGTESEKEGPAAAHLRHKVHIGLMGTVHGTYVGRELFQTAGGGLLLAWVVDPGRFELELSGRVVATEGGFAVTQDLLAKFPFHLTHSFHPFVGIGPSAAEFQVAGETSDSPMRTGWGLGAAVEGGAYLWLTGHLALFLSFDYALLYRKLSAEGVTQSGTFGEFGTSAGMMAGF